MNRVTSNQRILAEPILVGREKELEDLWQSLRLAIEGKGKTVFVSGEAGSGKTRVTREFLNVAIERGVAVMAGWCLSDSQAPFFPFIEAFNSYYPSNTEEAPSISLHQSQPSHEVTAQIGIDEREIASWLAGPASAMRKGKLEMLSPEVWKDQALAAISKTVHTIALQAPVILFIEDLHWADSASLALLHYLSRAIKNSDRVLLLATFRSEEVTTDAEGHPHPLAETLRLMRREELFTEIKLPSLDQANVSKLAESMLGSCVQPEFTERLTVQSGGSPLFVVESLRMLSEHGGLVKDGACVRLDVDKVSIPSKVKDIILRRVGSLRREQRRALDAASVIGEEFNVEFLSEVLEQDSLNVLETLSSISDSTSLVLDEGDRFRFDHARSRETLYEQLSPSLRKGYHNRIAEKLENPRTKLLPLSDLAYHFALAGNKGKAVKYAFAAGNDELAKWSNAQAIQHFQYVIQNIPEHNSVERITSLEGLGDGYSHSYMFGPAIKVYDQLAHLGTGVTKLRAYRKAMECTFLLESISKNWIEYGRKAVELGDIDRLEMARVIMLGGKAHKRSITDSKIMLKEFDEVQQVFEEENSLVDLADALRRRGLILTSQMAGGILELAGLLRAVAVYRELGDLRNEVGARLDLGFAFSCNGLFSEAAREFVEVHRIGENLGAFFELAYAENRLGILRMGQDNVEEAKSHALRGLDYLKKAETFMVESQNNALFCQIYSFFGDLKRADEFFGLISKWDPKSAYQREEDLPAGAFVSVLVAKGMYFAAKERWEESNLTFAKTLERVLMPGFEIRVRARYAWALEKQGRFEDAKVQRDKVQRISEQVEERYGHAHLQLGFMVPRKVQIGEEFEARIDLVNVGRKPGLLARVDGVVHPDFTIIKLPPFCKLQNINLVLADKSVSPFEVETIKLTFSAQKVDTYLLTPAVSYTDDLGTTKTQKLNPITIKVEPAKPAFEVLPGRVTTGTMELDRLLYGGIPEGCAVVLVSPSFEERQKLIENYIEAGLKSGQTTFHLTTEPGSAKVLAEEFPSTIFLFVCNPRADLMIKDLPNVYKIKGIDSLTEIDISLTKASRLLNASANQKRACIEVVSDVLLQHHAVTTRKWLTGMIQDLKSKGFIILAVIDPLISPEEIPAITSLFDGEIRIAEKETEKGMAKTLRVLKLQGQPYLKEEVNLA